MDPKRFVVLLARLMVQLLLAGVFYFVWMGILILDLFGASALSRPLIWTLAPVMTAAGYAIGMWLCDRVGRREPIGFCRLYAWPLVGCAVGAGVTCRFGPMLIVFGMFFLGTAAVMVREAWEQRKLSRGDVGASRDATEEGTTK